jgi:hypothetical protein
VDNFFTMGLVNPAVKSRVQTPVKEEPKQQHLLKVTSQKSLDMLNHMNERVLQTNASTSTLNNKVDD